MGREARPLKLLLVEESERDASALLDHLRRSGYDVAARRVVSREEMEEALEAGPWDLVVCAYVISGFSGLEAVGLVAGSRPELPVIVVSGKVGEEAAVEAMRAGAKDFVLKGNLSRLTPAIERELREVEVRRERRRGRDERERLRREAGQRQRLLEAISENAPAVVAVFDGASFRVRWANEVMRQSLDHQERHPTLEGLSLGEAMAAAEPSGLLALVRSVARSGVSVHESSFRLGSGTQPATWWHLALAPLPREGEPIFDVLLLAVETTELVLERERADAERARLRALIETMPLGVVLIDAQGGFELVNPEAQRLFGSPPSGTAARPTGGYQLLGEDRSPVPADELPLVRASRGEPVREARLRVRQRSGRELIIRVSASPVRDASGKVVGAVSAMQDVTAQERVQEELRISEARLDAFFNRSPVALVILDERLRRVRANPVAEKLVGLPIDQDTGRRPERHEGRLGPDLAERLREVLRSGRPEKDVAVSSASPGAPGVERHWLSSHFPIELPGGTRGLGVVAVEVTERIHAERRLQLLAQVGSVLAGSFDYGETLQRVSEIAVKEMADWCFVDLLEGESGGFRRIAVAHADPSMAATAARFRRYYPAKATPSFGVSAAIRERRGNLVASVEDELLVSIARDPEHLELVRSIGPRSFVSAPLIARGRMLGVITFIRCEGSPQAYGAEELSLVEEVARRTALVIDNARLYAEAQEANAAREQFMNIVSHELRNPLSTIQNGLRLLSRSVPAEAVHRLEVIQRAADLQARLVEDLLDVARAARGKLQLVMAPVPIDRVVATALEGERSDAQAAELEIDAQLEPGLWVRGDADRLQQVVLNLLTNAVKFTPAGRRIHVRLYEKHGRGPGRRAWLEVEDEGVGIPKESLAKIFGLFEQVDVAPQRKRGLGIGLAMVKSIAEKHGGRAWAESEGQGKGSRFTVELPLIEPPGPAGAERGEAVETAAEGP